MAMISDAVGTAALAWGTALAQLMKATPQVYREHGAHGTLLFFTGSPVPTLNGLLSTAAEPDVAEIAHLAAAAAGRAQGVPWSIRLRAQPDADIARIAASHGLTEKSLNPFMIAPLGRSQAPDPRSDALTIRTITGAESEAFLTTLADGFEAPREPFEVIASPPVLDAPGATAYLAELDGVPVATAFSTITGGHLGVFSVSTRPEHRKRGYGRAVTEAAMRGGCAAGAHTAYLHSTEHGIRVYESLGFRTMEYWTDFTAA